MTGACARRSRKITRPARWPRSRCRCDDWREAGAGLRPADRADPCRDRCPTPSRRARRARRSRSCIESLDVDRRLRRPSAAWSAHRRRRRRADGASARCRRRLLAQQLLHAADGIAFFVEQAVDAARQARRRRAGNSGGCRRAAAAAAAGTWFPSSAGYAGRRRARAESSPIVRKASGSLSPAATVTPISRSGRA